MTATQAPEQTRTDNQAIRPFEVGFPEEELAELRRRVNATRWPERETVSDDSQGVRLAMMQEPRAIGGRTTTGASARRN
jgi:hypothetical protein